MAIDAKRNEVNAQLVGTCSPSGTNVSICIHGRSSAIESSSINPCIYTTVPYANLMHKGRKSFPPPTTKLEKSILTSCYCSTHASSDSSSRTGWLFEFLIQPFAHCINTFSNPTLWKEGVGKASRHSFSFP